MAITNQDRLDFIVDRIFEDPTSHLWDLFMEQLGITEDDFTAPGDVTPGESFFAALDRNISKSRGLTER